MMNMSNIRTCHKNNSSVSVTIPYRICEKYDIESGDAIEFIDNDGTIEIRKLGTVDYKTIIENRKYKKHIDDNIKKMIG